ncbi:MAG: hypothetical protein QM759_00950 [Terricaulis sp.]
MRKIAKLKPVDTELVARCRLKLGECLTELLIWLATALCVAPPAWRACPIAGPIIRQGEIGAAQALRYCVRLLRRLLLVAAVADFHQSHPRNMPPRYLRRTGRGIRRMRRTNPLVRRVTLGVLSGMHAGALLERARRVKRALERFDVLVARVHKRCLRANRVAVQGALVINAPQCDALFSGAAPEIAAADSS